MNAAELLVAITAASVSIANQLADDQLNTVGAVFVQLGQSLQTIATVRELQAEAVAAAVTAAAKSAAGEAPEQEA